MLLGLDLNNRHDRNQYNQIYLGKNDQSKQGKHLDLQQAQDYPQNHLYLHLPIELVHLEMNPLDQTNHHHLDPDNLACLQ